MNNLIVHVLLLFAVTCTEAEACNTRCQTLVLPSSHLGVMKLLMVMTSCHFLILSPGVINILNFIHLLLTCLGTPNTFSHHWSRRGDVCVSSCWRSVWETLVSTQTLMSSSGTHLTKKQARQRFKYFSIQSNAPSDSSTYWELAHYSNSSFLHINGSIKRFAKCNIWYLRAF